MDRLSRALRRASAIADAVLAPADQGGPWPPGVLVPPGARAQTGAMDSIQTECLLVPTADTTLAVRLRYRWAQLWRITWDGADHAPGIRSTRVHGAGAETVRRRIDVVLPLADVDARVRRYRFALPGLERSHPLPGTATARLIRRRWPISGALEVSAHRLDGGNGPVRLRVEVHNDVVWRAYDAPPEVVLRRALIGVHVLLTVNSGQFLSMVDPPDWARAAAADCVNAGTFPVLVGDPHRNDTMLSAPIPLGDYPALPGTAYPAPVLARATDEMPLAAWRP